MLTYATDKSDSRLPEFHGWKSTSLIVTHTETGEQFKWRFWRDTRSPSYWVLQTHDNELRTLEQNWINSVPRINLTAENYGCSDKSVS